MLFSLYPNNFFLYLFFKRSVLIMSENGIYIIKDHEEFLKVIEEMQAQYLQRHENGVGENE